MKVIAFDQKNQNYYLKVNRGEIIARQRQQLTEAEAAAEQQRKDAVKGLAILGGTAIAAGVVGFIIGKNV